jgi:hypothetical protein
MQSVQAARALLWVGVLGVGSVGCVESFDGSKIELFLGDGVHVPGDNDPGRGKPPSDTHYEMYVVTENRPFKVFEFEVKTVIDRSSLCFIEDEESRYPGLHATQYAARLTEDLTTGHTPNEFEAGLIFNAEKRMSDQGLLEQRVKSVASHESGLTEQDIIDAYLAAGVPSDPTLMDDATNEQRFQACNEVFDAHPRLYVGNDKVLSLPLNGIFYGVVNGMDPRNNAYIAGAAFDVDAVLDDFDVLRINWNFNDPDDPRRADYDPSNIGYHYMAGTPERRTRGVINVVVRHRDFPEISGDLAIFADLATDDVQF